MATPTSVYDVAVAIAAWEQAELSVKYPTLVSYPTAPTADQWQAGVRIPFVLHRVDESNYDVVSINTLGSTEDHQVHKIWSLLVFGLAGDPLESLIKRDMDWRFDYRIAYLRHLRMGISGAHQLSDRMGKIVPMGLDEANESYVGIQVPHTIDFRTSYPTGL